MREFTFVYLKDDGIFAMRILAASASDLIVTEIISELWKNFKQTYVEASGGDEMTLISSSSSSSTSSSSNSSSTNSSHHSSAASSPLPITPNNQQAPLTTNKQALVTATSPSNSFVKKPFNYPQTMPGKQYSAMNQPPPPLQQTHPNSPLYSNTNTNNNSNLAAQSNALPLSNLSTNVVYTQSSAGKTVSNSPPPPVPQSNMPNLSESAEEAAPLSTNNVSRRHNSNNFRESNLYPQIQQRVMNHENSHANPDAKNTHV